MGILSRRQLIQALLNDYDFVYLRKEFEPFTKNQRFPSQLLTVFWELIKKDCKLRIVTYDELLKNDKMIIKVAKIH